MSQTRINLILARAANGVIGRDGSLPWHLPEDLAHFRQQTLGAPVIMGRRTWDSLPPRFRPLPGRRNMVISRNAAWQAEGAERFDSLLEAVAACAEADAPEVWVIGGAQIFAEAEPLAHRAVITEIERDFEGDVWAPQFDVSWHVSSRERGVSSTGLPYAFVTMERAQA